MFSQIFHLGEDFQEILFIDFRPNGNREDSAIMEAMFLAEKSCRP